MRLCLGGSRALGHGDRGHLGGVGFGDLAGIDHGNGIVHRRLIPVSYTHLDVYKRQAVVALHIMALGQRAPVQLKVKLAGIRGQIRFRLQPVQVIGYGAVVAAGAALQVLHPPAGLQHLEHGPSAAVAKAVSHQAAVVDLLMGYKVLGAGAALQAGDQVLGIGPGVGSIEMGHDRAAVQPLPPVSYTHLDVYKRQAYTALK